METLSTERLTIRPFSMDDLEEAHQLLDHDLQWAGPLFSLAQRRERLQREIYLSQWDDSGKIYGYRAMILTDSQTLIGICGFIPVFLTAEIQVLFWPLLFELEDMTPSNYTISTLELGYALSPKHRGKGYATEALRALIAYAFQTLSVGRLFASTNRSNSDSIRMMKRIGMRTASNPQHPEMDWPNGPGVLGVINNNRL